MVNPAGNDEQREWFEAVNFGPAVEVKTGRGGWLVYDGKNHYFQSSSFTWNTNEAVIFAQDKNKFSQDYSQVTNRVIESSFYLKNSAGTIRLLDERKNVLAQLAYPDSSREGYSLVANNSGGVGLGQLKGAPGLYPEPTGPTELSPISAPTPTSDSQPTASSNRQIDISNQPTAPSQSSALQTPKTSNQAAATNPPLPTVLNPKIDNGLQAPITGSQAPSISNPPQFFINEFLPNAKGKDEAEFIELLNSSSEKINLADFTLKVGSKNIALQGETNQSYVILWKKDFGFSIRNKGEAIVLIWKGQELHRISYQGQAPEGKSFAKIGSSWFWTKPTPAGHNVLIEEAEAPKGKMPEKDNSLAAPNQFEETANNQFLPNSTLAQAKNTQKTKSLMVSATPFLIGFILALVIGAVIAVLFR